MGCVNSLQRDKGSITKCLDGRGKGYVWEDEDVNW